MEWFLINVLTPLLLPVFVIAVIGLIADIKPDAFIKIYIDIIQTIVLAILRAIWQIAKFFFEFLCRLFSCLIQCLCCSFGTKSGTGKTGAGSRCKPCETGSDGSSDDTSPGAPPKEKKKPGRKPKAPK